MTEQLELQEDVMLTTLDNPYNPFTHFEEWYAYDVSQGYHTCSYLARVVKDVSDLDEEQADVEINKSIEEIVTLNLLGNYCKITINGKKLVI